MKLTLLACLKHPLTDDREWDVQCARCGSSVSLYEKMCLSSPEYCEAHPQPGRESVPRGELEWFPVGE